jgi:hypothetical protein
MAWYCCVVDAAWACMQHFATQVRTVAGVIEVLDCSVYHVDLLYLHGHATTVRVTCYI